MFKNLKLLALQTAAVLFFALSSGLAFGEDTSKFRLDLPLLDLPFNSQNNGSFPSMSQSLAISRTTYDLAHLGLEQFESIDPKAEGWDGFRSRLTYAGIDFLFFYLPGGSAWLHEEWHRAVMTHRGVSSKNDVYDLRIGQSVIAVSHETDDGLARLKEQHPEDQVRLAAAGMEAEHALIQDLETDIFFQKNDDYRTILLWMLQIGPISYLNTCNSGKTADEMTEEQNKNDGTSISKRDFIGLDCLGWIRDLNRPNETYAERGVHPSGVGIDRYTTYSELSPMEREYLNTSKNLSYLNLVDPFLFHKNEFKGQGWFGESEANYNFKLRHDLTSFGNSVSSQIFYDSAFIKSHASLFLFQNYKHSFPGLEINLFDVEIGAHWTLDIRGQIWKQPREFLFNTSSGVLGGLGGIKATYSGLGDVHPYLNVIGKTSGWVSGIVNQDRSLETILGFIAYL
jgi:hypothetical protein